MVVILLALALPAGQLGKVRKVQDFWPLADIMRGLFHRRKTFRANIQFSRDRRVTDDILLQQSP